MADVARLTVALHANSAQFVSDLKQSKKVAKGWSKDVAKGFADMAKTTSIAAGASAAAVAGIGYAIKSSLDSIDEMTRTAANLSIPVQKFGDLAYAAKLSGTSMDKMADVIKDVSVRIQDTANGSQILADFFTQIGQSAEDWAQMRPDQQFKKFVDEINKMDANQARFWLDEINDSAAEMFNTLYGSDAAFNKFVSEAEKAGLSIDKNMAHNAQMARVEFDRLFAVVGGTWQNVIASSAPAIEYVLDGLNDWLIATAKANGGFQNLGKALAVSMIEATRQATHAFFGMMDSVKAEIRDIGDTFGRDWFQVKNADSLKLSLKDIRKSMSDIEESGSWVAGNDDVPGYWRMSSEQIAKYNELSAQALAVQKKLSGETDLTAFDSELNAIIGKINTPQSVKIGTTVATGVIKTPPSSGKTQAQLAQEQALISYQDASQKMLQEQQRRLALLAAGDNAALVQEKFNHEDRIRSLVESYQAAYDANANDKEAQKELQNQYYSDMEAMAADHESQLTLVKQQEAEKRKGIEGRIEQQITGMKFAVANQALGLIESTSKEGSAIQKAAFIAQKAMAAAQVFMQGEVAATAALAPPPIGLGPVAGIGQAASIRAMSMVSMGMIGAQAIAGMAHSGIDEIPKEGTWLLDKGERVLTGSSARKMDELHSMALKGQTGSNQVNWTINVENHQGEAQVDTYIDDEKKVVSIVLRDINSSGQIYNSLSQKLGVKGGGWK